MGVKHFAAAATLSLVLCATPTVAAYADEVTNSPPQTPQIENLSTDEANRLITDYNAAIDEYNQAAEQEYYNQLNEVTSYNESVDQHNAQVDLDYEQALQETEKQNSEIINHNASEEQRVATENAINEQREQEAAARNVEIDNENAAGRAKAEESVVNHNNAIAENEEVQRYNAEVDKKYKEDLAQYDSDYEAYSSPANQTDIKNKQALENAGYTIEQYNMAPLKSPDEDSWQYILDNAVYRNKVREENTNLKDKEYTSTVSIQKSDNPSGQTFTLHVEHILIGGETYVEEIGFDANDIVTVNSLAFSQNCKPLYENETYGAFYSYQGNSYLSKYWYVSPLTYILSPPSKDGAAIQDLWNKGNEFIINYQSGKKYASDSNIIDVCYYYVSQMTCNIPLEEPISPQKGEYRAEVEVPDIIVWEDLPYVTPELINVLPADIWQLIDEPVKGDYLTYMPYPEYPVLLAHMDYLAQETPTYSNEPRTIQWLYPNDDNSSITLSRSMGVQRAYAATIEDSDTPLDSGQAQPQSVWALVNLILMLITILILVKIPRKKEDDETDQYYYKHHNNIIGILLAIAAVILFILTENVWLPMVMVDSWTIWMAFICGGAIVARFFSRTTKEKIEE